MPKKRKKIKKGGCVILSCCLGTSEHIWQLVTFPSREEPQRAGQGDYLALDRDGGALGRFNSFGRSQRLLEIRESGEKERERASLTTACLGEKQRARTHLGRRAEATAPRAPAATAGLALVPRSGGDAVGGATLWGAARGAGGTPRDEPDSGAALDRPARLGRWTWRLPELVCRSLGVPTRARAQGVGTFRRRGAHLPPL